MNRGGKGENGEDGFEGVKVICYDSADWVRKNFKAKVDERNEVGRVSGLFAHGCTHTINRTFFQPTEFSRLQYRWIVRRVIVSTRSTPRKSMILAGKMVV